MTEILFPAGRLVQGSVHTAEPNDKGRPECYFAVAIPKQGETDFKVTLWGQQLASIATAGFPQGQSQRHDFAWKIIDGDSGIPDKKGIPPNTRQGYPGNWVVRFSSGFVPHLLNVMDGTQALITQPGFVNLGDYIQVLSVVKPNDSQQTPGLYLNHKAVGFLGYGERITYVADYSSVGFGQGAMPAGIQRAPAAAAPAAYAGVAAPAAAVPAMMHAGIQPNPAILQPPVASPPIAPPAMPPQPAKKMTAKAAGASYQQFTSQGWTDALLIQHGYMEA